MARKRKFVGTRKRPGSRPRSRRSSKSKSFSRPSKPRKPIPSDVKSQIVLLDQEEFYGIYLDIVMFNLQLPDVVKVRTHIDYKEFLEHLANKGSYEDNIYIVDETYGWGVLKIAQIVERIREADEKAVIIGATSINPEEILEPELFDHVIVKSKDGREYNVVNVLTSIMKLEFAESNSDKSYKGEEYMQQLLDQGDDYPQMIYRDSK